MGKIYLNEKFAVIDAYISHQNFNLTRNEFRVFIAISSFADDNGECFPKREDIAIYTGMNIRAISKSITGLFNKGIIERRFRFNSSNIYTIKKIQLNTNNDTIVGGEEVTGGVNSLQGEEVTGGVNSLQGEEVTGGVNSSDNRGVNSSDNRGVNSSDTRGVNSSDTNSASSSDTNLPLYNTTLKDNYNLPPQNENFSFDNIDKKDITTETNPLNGKSITDSIQQHLDYNKSLLKNKVLNVRLINGKWEFDYNDSKIAIELETKDVKEATKILQEKMDADKNKEPIDPEILNNLLKQL